MALLYRAAGIGKGRAGPALTRPAPAGRRSYQIATRFVLSSGSAAAFKAPQREAGSLAFCRHAVANPLRRSRILCSEMRDANRASGPDALTALLPELALHVVHGDADELVPVADSERWRRSERPFAFDRLAGSPPMTAASKAVSTPSRVGSHWVQYPSTRNAVTTITA